MDGLKCQLRGKRILFVLDRASIALLFVLVEPYICTDPVRDASPASFATRHMRSSRQVDESVSNLGSGGVTFVVPKLWTVYHLLRILALLRTASFSSPLL